MKWFKLDTGVTEACAGTEHSVYDKHQEIFRHIHQKKR